MLRDAGRTDLFGVFVLLFKRKLKIDDETEFCSEDLLHSLLRCKVRRIRGGGCVRGMAVPGDGAARGWPCVTAAPVPPLPSPSLTTSRGRKCGVRELAPTRMRPSGEASSSTGSQPLSSCYCVENPPLDLSQTSDSARAGMSGSGTFSYPFRNNSLCAF